MIKEQEREIKQKLKVVNKFYNKLGKQTLKENKAIKTFEYQIDLRIYKEYLDKDDKKIKRHWQFETDLAGNKYVIFRKFTSYKMIPSDLSFLKYTVGYFYNIMMIITLSMHLEIHFLTVMNYISMIMNGMII